LWTYVAIGNGNLIVT